MKKAGNDAGRDSGFDNPMYANASQPAVSGQSSRADQSGGTSTYDMPLPHSVRQLSIFFFFAVLERNIQLYATAHAPRAILYVIPMLVAC